MTLLTRPALHLSPDGRELIFRALDPGDQVRLYRRLLDRLLSPSPAVLDLESGQSTPIDGANRNARRVYIFPNGRWLVYSSDESGTYEVYLRRFPVDAGKWQVSLGGGDTPRWARGGSELFYVKDGAPMAVEVAGEESPALSRHR